MLLGLYPRRAKCKAVELPIVPPPPNMRILASLFNVFLASAVGFRSAPSPSLTSIGKAGEYEAGESLRSMLAVGTEGPSADEGYSRLSRVLLRLEKHDAGGEGSEDDIDKTGKARWGLVMMVARE